MICVNVQQLADDAVDGAAVGEAGLNGRGLFSCLQKQVLVILGAKRALELGLRTIPSVFAIPNQCVSAFRRSAYAHFI